VIPPKDLTEKADRWKYILDNSAQLVTVLDLGGQEKYFNATATAISSYHPDYCMIIIDPSKGMTQMTKDHIALSMAFKIPFAVIVNKIDDPNINMKEVMTKIKNTLKGVDINRKPLVVQNEIDMKLCAKSLETNVICPIFTTSCTEKKGIADLIKFFSFLDRDRVNNSTRPLTDKAQFDICDTFIKTDKEDPSKVSTILSGFVQSGTICLNEEYIVGPDATDGNKFHPVKVVSIHVDACPAERAFAGQLACLVVESADKEKFVMTKNNIKSGMFVLGKDSTEEDTQVFQQFDAKVFVPHHSTTIKVNYQSTFHCGVIKQAISVTQLPTEVMRSGDKGTISVKFLLKPELIRKGMRFVLFAGGVKM
jgi:elongation factor 1-alpha